MVPVNGVVSPSGGKILQHSKAAMHHLLSVQRLGSPSCAGHQRGATVPAGERRDHHSVVPYSVGVCGCAHGSVHTHDMYAKLISIAVLLEVSRPPVLDRCS